MGEQCDGRQAGEQRPVRTPVRTRPASPRQPRVRTLPRLLAAAVEADPDGTAVSYRGSVLRYRELDEVSARLARLLIGRGIGPGDLVALAIESSIESLSAMWAVAKTGAGFVPIGADAPAALGLTAGAGWRLPDSVEWLVLDDPGFRRELARYSGELVTSADRLRPILAADVAFMTCAGSATEVVSQADVTDVRLLHRTADDAMTGFLASIAAHARPEPEHTLVELFDRVVAMRPDAIAVRFGGAALTYRELDARANRLARRLIARGVGPESLVAVMLPRSLDLVVALLATVKSGGGYLPVDPTYPAQRIAYLFADAAPVCVLTEAGMAPPTAVPSIEMSEAVDESCAPITDADRRATLRPGNIAYVIYTSGSTGRPKGVAIPHRNVVALLANTRSVFGFDHDDVWTMFHSYAFDFSVWELWGPLLSGGTAVVVDYETSRSPAQFLALLRAERVTVLNQTPSAFYQLAQADQARPGPLSLRYIIFGGEALEYRRLDDWLARHDSSVTRLINMYGITETTVHATHHRVAGSSAIGSAITGLRIYVLDERLCPVPVSVPGEIYIAGSQLARGYLGKPALSAARFVANPFADNGSRMYRSGDLARWNADGDLLYLGRADHQVQVRGHRIELGEIEAALLAVASVRQAVVVAREDIPGDQRIVAYLVGEPDIAEIRAAAARALPGYMVPSAFVVIDALPLTAHGKVDRAALPAPMVETAPFRLPADPREQAVADAFAEVLGVHPIGSDDDFFSLGGNSLLAFTLQRAVSRRTGIELPMSTLFATSTVSGLAARLAGRHARGVSSTIEIDALLGPDIEITGRAPGHPGSPRDVLLTGATGFVGAYLLRELCDRTDAQVWCLVRANSARTARDRIRAALQGYHLWDDTLEARIVPVPGDLGEPSFGLAAAEFTRLAHRIDVIYHNGARVNHVEPYSRLRAANVEGTREVLRLATTHYLKPVHFVSAANTVIPAAPHGVIRESSRITAAELPASGYVTSKWVAEQLILQAGERGLPVRVYRPGLVSGDLRSGIHNTDDSFWNMIRAAAILGIAPEVGDAAIALVPVTYVAAALVAISTGTSTATEYHLVNESPTLIRTIFDRLRRHGIRIDTEALNTMHDRLTQEAHLRNAAGDDSLVRAAVLSGNYAGGTADLVWDAANTRHALVDTGIRCPAIDERVLDTYIAAFLASGFLPAPTAERPDTEDLRISAGSK